MGHTTKGKGTMKLNANEKKIVALTKSLADCALNNRPMHSVGFNWGFLWGRVIINRRQKNGKVKTFQVKVLLTSGCPDSWSEVQTAVEAIPGVSGTYVNLD